MHKDPASRLITVDPRQNHDKGHDVFIAYKCETSNIQGAD